MDVRALANPEPPTTGPWRRLAELLDRRADLAAHLDGLDHEQRASSQAAVAAAAHVADLERRGLAGETVTAEQTKKAAQALTRARARQAEPWPERRDGARRAITDHDHEIQRFVAANYAELQEGLRQQGREATRAVEQAAAALVEAHSRWETIGTRMNALASSVRPVQPGDWARARAERAAAEASKLLDQGEVEPDVRSPLEPRHPQPVEGDEADVVAMVRAV
jgi:hypothetical protein